MGSLRLLLAVMVLVSHSGITVAGLNPGVVAVVVFYLISGYVMAALLDSHYLRPPRPLLFYADRAGRIFPQYLFYAVIALVWQLAVGARTMFLTRDPGIVDIANNLAVVPLNYYMFSDALGYVLVPPAWSLGAELQFYLLAPAMLLWPAAGIAMCSLSLGVEGLAMAGVLHTDWFGYRTLPGVLWVFGVGMVLFRLRGRSERSARSFALAVAVAAGGVALLLHATGKLPAPYNREVLLGIGAGACAVHVLGGYREGRVSHWAGNVSYGVFLNHFLLMWLFFPSAAQGKADAPTVALLVAASVAAAIASQWIVERPVLRWRRRLRRPAAPAIAASSAAATTTATHG